eukprot:1158926-Pelagomonas_calceolata.AAC.9
MQHMCAVLGCAGGPEWRVQACSLWLPVGAATAGGPEAPQLDASKTSLCAYKYTADAFEALLCTRKCALLYTWLTSAFSWLLVQLKVYGKPRNLHWFALYPWVVCDNAASIRFGWKDFVILITSVQFCSCTTGQQ